MLYVLRIIFLLIIPINSNATIYVFISNSMGKSLLSDYVIEAEKYDATLVFRGLVNGSFKDSGILASEILKGRKVGIIIDDNLFKKYSIEAVPAIILLNEDTGSFHKIVGNIGIANSINLFKELGDTK